LTEAEGATLTIVNRECLECHRIDGVGAEEGPDLSDVGSRFDAAAIERQITNPYIANPDSMMPAFEGLLSPEEIRAIAEWLARRR
jgi:mono/diheme cytochrome c family protein